MVGGLNQKHVVIEQYRIKNEENYVVYISLNNEYELCKGKFLWLFI